jgi:hypothetical protein
MRRGNPFPHKEGRERAGLLADQEELWRPARRYRRRMLQSFLPAVRLRARLCDFGAWKVHDSDGVGKWVSGRRAEYVLGRDARRPNKARTRVG